MALPLFYATYLVFSGCNFNRLRFRFIWVWFLCVLQGLVGWFMVKSGLLSDPYVSPYRLSLHMLLAIIIISIFIWTYLDLHYKTGFRLPLSGINLFIIFLLFLTIFFGVLVAGLKAGLIYNTFPLMGNNFIPIEIGSFIPIWKDILENPSTVQFIHRYMALFSFLFISFYSLIYFSSNIYKILFCLVVLQFLLGIFTLLMHVPLVLALLHQLLGVILFMFLIYAFYNISFKRIYAR